MPTKLSVKTMDYNVFCLQHNNNMILFNYNINKVLPIFDDKYTCKFICKPKFTCEKLVDLKLIQIFPKSYLWSNFKA